jgi:penicillin-binding protein-related factor A (putative recombinase)
VRKKAEGIPHAGRGSALERTLELAHQVYRDRDLVWIRHNRTAGAWRGKRFVPMPDKSAPDYYGCLRGRFLAFEAKECRDTRWLLKTNSAHQLGRLQALAVARAVAWFAVEEVRARELTLVRIWPDSPRPAFDFRAPLEPDMLRLPLGPEGFYDWLPLVRSAWFV